MRIINYLAILLTGCILCSCEKDSALNVDPDLRKLKIYNDTAISGDNTAFNIYAGIDRIFVTYGYKYYFMYSNNVADYTNLQPAVMATDNNGNLLWKSVLPEAFEECAVVSLDDGGCIVASQMSFGTNDSFSKSCFYLFHFNRNGELTKTDSVSVTPYISTSATYNNYLNVIKTSEGKIIFYGDIWGRDNGYISGFAFEYSPVTGLVWFKDYILPFNGSTTVDILLHGCVQTDDNALMFCGSRDYYDAQFNVVRNLILIKTDFTGNVIWTREFEGGSSYFKGGIVKTTNGRYWVFHNIAQGKILELNSGGDSLRSLSLPLNRFISSLTPTVQGGCIALVNNSGYNAFAATFDPQYYQTNTYKVTFDSELNIISDKPFQTVATDFLPVSCKTSAGDLASFGLIQAKGKTYYLPHLYLSKQK